jgi:predicted neutral ceramidase superfamily lipid hydrolase
MKSWQKLLWKLLSLIITFCFLYEIISSIIITDFLSSLLPSWHTSLNSASESLRITALLSISTAFVYLLFKLIYRSLTYLWVKIILRPKAKTSVPGRKILRLNEKSLCSL